MSRLGFWFGVLVICYCYLLVFICYFYDFISVFFAVWAVLLFALFLLGVFDLVLVLILMLF